MELTQWLQELRGGGSPDQRKGLQLTLLRSPALHRWGPGLLEETPTPELLRRGGVGVSSSSPLWGGAVAAALGSPPNPSTTHPRLDQRLDAVAALLLLSTALGSGLGPVPAVLPEALRSLEAPLRDGWLLTLSLREGLDSLHPNRLLARLSHRLPLHQALRDLLQRRVLARPYPLSSSHGRTEGGHHHNPLAFPLLELYLGELDRFLEAGVALAPFRGPTPPGPPRLRWLRSGDQLLLLLEGSRKEALELQKQLCSFIRGNLALAAHPSGPLHPSDGIPFRGYHLRRVGTKTGDGPQRLRPELPMGVVLPALVEAGLLRRKPDGRFFPTSCKTLLREEPETIVATLAGLFGAFCGHYRGVVNRGDLVQLLDYYGRSIAAMTLAHKASVSTPVIRQRYTDWLEIPDGGGGWLLPGPVRRRQPKPEPTPPLPTWPTPPSTWIPPTWWPSSWPGGADGVGGGGKPPKDPEVRRGVGGWPSYR